MNISLVLERGEWGEKWMNELMGRQVNRAPARYGRLLLARRDEMNDGGDECISLSVD